MFVSPLNNNQINHENIENVNDPETTELLEENVVDQEAPKTTKDLPDIFSLQAQAKAVQKKKEVGILPKKI